MEANYAACLVVMLQLGAIFQFRPHYLIMAVLKYWELTHVGKIGTASQELADVL